MGSGSNPYRKCMIVDVNSNKVNWISGFNLEYQKCVFVVDKS